tara:strand:+ start:600 stop:1106 length:507 start_codon:yes stop_codon:yes gene_type:complete
LKWKRILKRQTTLHGFDPKQVQRLIKPKRHNFFIAAKPANKNLTPKEMSKLADKMLDELARLNVGNKFTITSATGKTPDIWGTEPSFMLTGVPTSLESKIYEMADKYGQDAIAVSEEGEKGAKFITPKGKFEGGFEDMEFDPDAEYSTDFPSGQRLTFTGWKEPLKKK